jgi:aryl-alcohol dehydrogenase-like predicted oxidoreductase
MQTVTLGATRLEVTPLAYGTWQFGGDWGLVDERAAMAAIQHARSLGINFFDTAQAYGFGRSERLLGRALADDLRSARDSVVIATKGGLRIDGDRLVRDASPGWLRKGVEASLEALGTDYIDLYQVHWPDPATPICDTAAELAGLVHEGLIRHVGVSNFTTAQIDEFSFVLPAETVQPPYHLFRRDIEADLLPYAAAHDIGVLAYGPLAHGLLGGAIGEANLRDHLGRQLPEMAPARMGHGPGQEVAQAGRIAEHGGEIPPLGRPVPLHQVRLPLLHGGTVRPLLPAMAAEREKVVILAVDADLHDIVLRGAGGLVVAGPPDRLLSWPASPAAE